MSVHTTEDSPPKKPRLSNAIPGGKDAYWSVQDLEVFQRPLCLVTAGEKNVLQVEDDVLDQIRQIDKPCVIVAIAGLYRTGKSYLMNRLADANKGFALGDTIRSKTKGIWIWCRRHPRIANTVLVLLDTEGLGDVKKGDPSHDNRIFTLATLLCSTLVYNMKGAFDQDAVNKLTFVSEMAKHIRFGGRCDENNSMLTCILPGFVLVLRDFSLKMVDEGKPLTHDEYLETSLENDDELGADFNKPRESIRKFFPSDKRKCFALPPPGDIDVIENLEKLTFKDISKRFQDIATSFVDFIYDQAAPKELMISKPVTGPMFAVLTQQYVDALRQGAVPDVDNAFEAVAKMENAKVEKAALAMFHEALLGQALPVPYKQLEQHYQRVQWTALEYARNNAVLDTKHSVEKDVQSNMETVWMKRNTENEQEIIKYCESCIETLQSKHHLIDGVQKKAYAVVGGHRKFKLDFERVGDEYHSTLKVLGYADRETALTWSTFMLTLAEVEMEIIRLDDSLSEEEKKREREENKQEMQRMVDTMNDQSKEALEDQRQTYEAQQREIEKQRDMQAKDHEEKMSKMVKQIADLETDKEEHKVLQKRVQEMEAQAVQRKEEEKQWRKEERERQEKERRQHAEEISKMQREIEKAKKRRHGGLIGNFRDAVGI